MAKKFMKFNNKIKRKDDDFKVQKGKEGRDNLLQMSKTRTHPTILPHAKEII